MTPSDFVCDYSPCRWYKQRVRLAGDFPCHKQQHCLGWKMRRGEVPPLTPPLPPVELKAFWRREYFLVAILLIPVVGFVDALLVNFFRKTGETAESSRGHMQTGDAFTVAPRTPSTINLPAPDVRFEVNNLLASADLLLDLWRGQLIARRAAESKALNGQNVTSSGRTADEALDQVKSNYRDQQFFMDAVRASDEKISRETAHYLDIIHHMTTFPDRTVQAAFDAVRANPDYNQREIVALGLAEQHVTVFSKDGDLSIEQVYNDYQQKALR